MAPSATETITLASRPVEQNTTLKVTGGIGAYKELAPTTFQKENELKGIEGHEKAKVFESTSHCIELVWQEK